MVVPKRSPLVLAWIAAALIACSSETSPSARPDASADASGDAVADDTARSDGDPPLDAARPDTAGGCNNVSLSSRTVTIESRAEALPTLGGGTIVPGTYAHIKSTAYTGPGGSTEPFAADGDQKTWLITATEVQEYWPTEDPTIPPRRTMTMTTAGNSISLLETCPVAAAAPNRGSFEATATSLKYLRDFTRVVDEYVRVD